MNWKTVRKGVTISWDLEETPLQIKTDSTLGSGVQMWMKMYDNEENPIAYVAVKFSSSLTYKIGKCIENWTDLTVQPPVEVDKIWTITKTETALIITCNDVEVLNYLFTDSSNSNCVPKLGGNVVQYIEFISSDSASDFYKEMPTGKIKTAEAQTMIS
eukprot:sb/3473030/